MAESDYALLFREHNDAIITILFGFVSITSGFLAATYLVAKTIPTLLAFVLVSLYSVTGIALIGYCERHTELLSAIREQLRSAGADWHVAVSEPAIVLPFLSYALVIAMFAIFVASVCYFFYTRNSDAKNDREVAPKNAI